MNDPIPVQRPGRNLGRAMALLGLTLCLVPALAAAQEETSAPAAGNKEVPRHVRARQAFEELADRANARFEKEGFENEGVRRELMAEFGAFAEKYLGTEEAVIALLHRSTLARMLGEYDESEATLKRAQSLTSDPDLRYEIDRGLAELRIRPGADVPAFTAKAVSGEDLSAEGYKGKLLLIDFWATWCAPCVAELPNVKEVYAQYHPRGLEMLSVSLDEDRKYFENFIKREQMDWTHIYDADLAEDQRLAVLFGVTSIPRMILVGPDGKVIAAGLRGEQLGEAVSGALEKAAAEEANKPPAKKKKS